jgi:hypothetical protein
MNNQAGKGPEIRKGANLRAYWDNYDNIFRKEKKIDLHATILKNYVDEATKEDDRDMIELLFKLAK